MLAVVGVRGVGEEGQQLGDDDGEDFLGSASAIGARGDTTRRRAYLEVLRWVGRIGGEQLEHVDQTAARPGAHADILVLQQARRHELVRNRPQRLVVGLLLVNGAQLVQQRLETRQQVADTDGLARPPNQRLLEPQRAQPIVLLLCLFLLLLLVLLFSFLLLHNGALLLFGGGLGGGCSAAPAAWGHVACLRVRWGCI